MKRCLVCFVLAILFADESVNAQKAEKDSLKIYRKLESISKKHKITGILYNAIFNLNGVASGDSVIRNQKSFEVYNGKIVRNIIVETYDPFGYNLRDSSAKPRSFIQKGGNFLHNRSSELTIRNQLLIKRNKPFDALKFKESERLLRQSAYVQDVIKEVVSVAGTDSVDVIFREQDLWSIKAGVAVTATKQTLLVSDLNFLGLSHQLEAGFYHFNEGQKFLAQGSYSIPYLLNTYITTKAFYSTSNEFYVNGVSIQRPFYSSLTKWAGGVDYIFHGLTDSVRLAESSSEAYQIRYRDLDVWGGRSFSIQANKNDEVRTTKLITTARVLDRRYSAVPPPGVDSMNLYNTSQFYLGAIGISSRTYYRDSYIYRYGVPEDVPSGRMAQIIFGYEDGLKTGRVYAGAQAGYGDHFFQFGYLSTFLGYGTYLRNGKSEQSVINTSLGYFSDLLHLGSWGFRQFVKSQLVYGLYRKAGESININNENGIKGFESETLQGTNKIVLALQTHLYLPYSVIGFHFAPFIFCNLAMIGNDKTSIFKGQIYQGYGIGLLIKNELLAINTFQISFGFYPFIPDAGSGISKFNPLKTYNFTFRDFEIAKPGPVIYE